MVRPLQTVCKMWGKKCKLKQNWKNMYATSTSLYLFNFSTQFKNFANKFALFFENYIREPFPFLTCPSVCVRLWGLAKAIFGLIRKTIENSIQQYDKKLSKNEEKYFSICFSSFIMDPGIWKSDYRYDPVTKLK